MKFSVDFSLNTIKVPKFNQIFFFKIEALYGIQFKDKPEAYSAYVLAQTIGFLIGSLISTFCCTDVKVYVFIAIILASLIGYFLMLIKDVNKGKTIYTENLNNEKTNVTELNIY